MEKGKSKKSCQLENITRIEFWLFLYIIIEMGRVEGIFILRPFKSFIIPQSSLSNINSKK